MCLKRSISLKKISDEFYLWKKDTTNIIFRLQKQDDHQTGTVVKHQLYFF